MTGGIEGGMRKRPAVEPCAQCPINAKCCTRGVEVNAEQVKLIETLPLDVPKPWFTDQAFEWGDGTGPNRSTVVLQRGCVFLTDDFQCAIHRFCFEQGLEVKKYKPVDCLTYPFYNDQLSEDYEVFCGVYFGEPAASNDSSRPAKRSAA